MNLLILPLILLTAIPSAESVDGERWKPFDHPAVVERTFTAFTQPGDTLSLISGAMGFFKVDEVVFAEGDRIPGRDGEWVPAIRVDASIDIAQKKSLEIRLELAKSATETARLASVRADSAARLATKELERVSALLEKGDASQSVYDQVLQRAEEATAVSDTARVAFADSQLSVSLVESELNVIEEKIKQSTLLAPAGWYVEKCDVVQGSGLTMGQHMMTLVDRSYFKVALALTEEEIRALSVSPLKLSRVVDDSEIQPSKIRVGSVPHPETHRRLVTIDIPAEELSLRTYETGGGLEIRASLGIPDSRGGVRIPKKFIGQQLEQWIVKDTEGMIYTVYPVRSDETSWLVRSKDMPVGIELVPLTTE